MSILFTPKRIGPVEIANRFVAAPIYESMATQTGEVTDRLINKYRAVAKGGVGLVIQGYMYVNSVGKSTSSQTGIDHDKLIPGLKKLAESVHEQGSKIFFELAHGGRYTTKKLIGQQPLSASDGKADPVFRTKPRAMTKQEIQDTVAAFGEAAIRAKEAGADGIHIASAGASLFNQFLSPFSNKRTDEYGGPEENKYRILGETVKAVRQSIGKDMALTVKINTNDFTPKPGVTPDLAKIHAMFLVRDGIDGLETSQGTMAYSSMNFMRGDVPIDDLVGTMPGWMRPIGRLMIKRWVGKYDVSEAWSLPDVQTIKPAIGDTPLFLVGGLRKLSMMQKMVEEGQADFISLGRPLVREPNLVNKFRSGQSSASACVSCNGCSGQVLQGKPLRCIKLSETSAA
jgi:2,4-dienoyl-CoA reductase-like NADH-dependent reductase (Old Yellow Enzyme family)